MIRPRLPRLPQGCRATVQPADFWLRGQAEKGTRHCTGVYTFTKLQLRSTNHQTLQRGSCSLLGPCVAQYFWGWPRCEHKASSAKPVLHPFKIVVVGSNPAGEACTCRSSVGRARYWLAQSRLHLSFWSLRCRCPSCSAFAAFDKFVYMAAAVGATSRSSADRVSCGGHGFEAL